MPTHHFTNPKIQRARKDWIRERHRQLYGATRGLRTEPRQSTTAGYGVATRESTGKEGRALVKSAHKRNTSAVFQQGELP